MRENNCKLNRSKLNLCQTSVKFFEHILTTEGLKPDPAKVDAIRRIQSPENKKDVEKFVGLVNYLGRYMPNLSSELRRLRELTLQWSPWKWTETEQREFDKIKEIVANIVTLKYFDVNKPVTIQCDSSSHSLGAVLLQDNEAVTFASRSLTKSEKTTL